MYNNSCGCEKDKNPCSPNPKEQEFSKVVAAWQTVRHFKVHSYDTIRPICTDGLDKQNFEKCFHDKCKCEFKNEHKEDKCKCNDYKDGKDKCEFDYDYKEDKFKDEFKGDFKNENEFENKYESKDNCRNSCGCRCCCR